MVCKKNYGKLAENELIASIVYLLFIFILCNIYQTFPHGTHTLKTHFINMYL